MGAAYHIVVIAVAVWGILTGYRKGLIRLLGSVVAVAFGIVATRLIAPECFDAFEAMVPGFISGFQRPFVVQTLTCLVIYVLVTGIFELVAIPLGKLMKVVPAGIVNSIGGALFRMFQFLILVSLFFNLIVDLNPSGELTRSSRLHDGNVVEVVMQMAPAILGFPGAEEVAHYQQLEDAKKIS